VVANTAGCAVSLDRGRVQIMKMVDLATLLPEVTVPSLPFIAAYAVMVLSLDDTEQTLRARGGTPRRHGPMLIVPVPQELGLGAWLFVESALTLPWRT